MRPVLATFLDWSHERCYWIERLRVRPPISPPREDDDVAAAAAAACAGDAEAFRRLINLTHGRLFRLAYHLTGRGHDAEEIVQDTYVRAWRSIGSLRDVGAALPWLARITRNLACERRRGRGHREHVLEAAHLECLGGQAIPPDELIARRELALTVRKAVDALADKYREVLLLREVDDMSYEQIAQLLGVPVGTVESRLHRARHQLARVLARMQRQERGKGAA